jgi:hypothetical protein
MQQADLQRGGAGRSPKMAKRKRQAGGRGGLGCPALPAPPRLSFLALTRTGAHACVEL